MDRFLAPAEAAARWWAARLAGPMQLTEAELDDRKLTRILIDRQHASKPEAAQLDAFESELTFALVSALTEQAKIAAEEGRHDSLIRVPLSSDVTPCVLLKRAAIESGISLGRFPLRAGMTVRLDHVSAHYNGQKSRLVWASDTYTPAACGKRPILAVITSADQVNKVCSLPRDHDGDCGQWAAEPGECARCGKDYGYHRLPGQYSQDRCYRFQEAV